MSNGRHTIMLQPIGFEPFTMLSDYANLIAPVIAIINSVIAIAVAHFKPEKMWLKITLLSFAIIFGLMAAGSTIYVQYQAVADRDAASNRNKEIRTKLGEFIQKGTTLIVGCNDPTKPVPTAQFNAWLMSVTTYLQSELGPSYVQRILTPIGSLLNASCNGASPAYVPIVKVVLNVNAHLEEFSQQANF